MAFTLTALLTSIENLLVKNNVTGGTYYLGSGLNERPKSFNKGAVGFSDKPLTNLEYPAINIELVRKEEDFSNMGNRNKRNMLIEIDIVAITHYGAGIGNTGTSAKEIAHLECIQLTDNIEYLLRNKINLSQTSDKVASSRIMDTRYLDEIRNSYFNCNSRIRLEIQAYNTL